MLTLFRRAKLCLCLAYPALYLLGARADGDLDGAEQKKEARTCIEQIIGEKNGDKYIVATQDMKLRVSAVKGLGLSQDVKLLRINGTEPRLIG